MERRLGTTESNVKQLAMAAALLAAASVLTMTPAEARWRTANVVGGVALVPGPATGYPGYGPAYGYYGPAYDFGRGYVYGYAPVSGAAPVYAYEPDFGYAPIDARQPGYATPYSEIFLVRERLRRAPRVRAIIN